MRYWFVIHDLGSFSQHGDYIGCGVRESGVKKASYGPFGQIQKGDKIVYYAKGDKVVVGIFQVVSDIEYWPNDPEWGERVVFKIAPEMLPPKGKYLDFKAYLFNPEVSLDLFPDKDRWAFQLWNHTCRPLTKHDFDLIRSAVETLQVRPTLAKGQEYVKIGAPLSGTDLLFEPTDETGVVFLFAKYHRQLGFPYVKQIREKFPDAVVLDHDGHEKTVEFELMSSNFPQHGHGASKCDFIVCWEHDWTDMPREVEGKITIVSLKEALPDLLR
ncbi:EVE domain-containing protein [Candidatus Bathyarchaeota archaeon]|nr:EVE domain-containing protein [Candidatus Bathyarchaeota archaeon]